MVEKTYHVLGLSGGRDSAALALHMKKNYPNLDIAYFYTDTGKELPEVEEFLEDLSGELGKDITKLNPDRDFDYWLTRLNNFLPSPQARWCTVNLKIRPFEKWVAQMLKNGGKVTSYVAIRADENRSGLVTSNPNIKTEFPLHENGIDLKGVRKILTDHGLKNEPKYYDWRSRSGCTFCFYQQKIEWLRLKERHPDKFEEAKSYEKTAKDGKSKFTWCSDESLIELEQPERAKAIQEDFDRRKDQLEERRKKMRGNPLLHDMEGGEEITVDEVYGIDSSKAMCISCHK